MVIILHGPDSFRSQEKVREIISAYRAKHGTHMHETRIDSGLHAWDEVRKALYGGSLFAQMRLLVVRNVHANKELLGNFLIHTSLMARPDVVVVFWEDAVLGKTKDEKSLLETATQSQEFAFLPPARLRLWVGKYAARYHIDISPPALSLLVAWSGGNTWYLGNEVRKLGAYTRGKTVSEQDVRMLSRDILDSHIFKTIDALFAGRTHGGLAYLRDHLTRGENPTQLLAMLAREVHVLATVKGGSRAGLHPFVVKKASPRARATSWEKLRQLSYIVHEADAAIKKGARDPSIGLELLGAQISTIMTVS